jgi:hypothetical protein
LNLNRAAGEVAIGEHADSKLFRPIGRQPMLCTRIRCAASRREMPGSMHPACGVLEWRTVPGFHRAARTAVEDLPPIALSSWWT